MLQMQLQAIMITSNKKIIQLEESVEQAKIKDDKEFKIAKKTTWLILRIGKFNKNWS